MMRPCADLVVVDLTTGMAGGLAAMILGDAGARVIRVEPVGGAWDRAEPAFSMWHRGHESLELDVHRTADRQTAVDLAAGADVVMESFRPGVVESLGLGYTELATRNPGLVYASISGFGPVARLAAVPGYDPLVAAATGRMNDLDELSGRAATSTRPGPVFVAVPTASYGAGLLAAQGVLAALHARDRTGRGDHVQTSLLEGGIAFLMRQEMPRDTAGPSTTEGDLVYAGIKLCFLTVECSDGRHLQMCARQDDQFRSWLRVAGLAALLDDPRFAGAPLGLRSFDDAAELADHLRAAMLTRPAATWLTAFAEADVGADLFVEPSDFLFLPQLVATGRVVEVARPGQAPQRQLGGLVTTASGPMVRAEPAPAPGEHGPLPRSRPAVSDGTSDTPAGGQPLDGVTIVDAATFIAAPMGATMLAELGARVVKIEPLAGDPYRRAGLQALKYQQGKESIALDLKDPNGREVLWRLADRADAFVHNLRPGVPERLGVDQSTLLARNPALVYLYASCYGSTGPDAHRAAFHSTPTALSGGGILQAGSGNVPVDDSYPDPGGALAVAVALLLGLRHRDATGAGTYLETTMLCSAGHVIGNDIVDAPELGPRPRADGEQRGFGPRCRLYRAADGWVFVLATTDDRWSAVRKALGAEEDDRDADGTLESVIAGYVADAVVTLVNGAGGAAVAVPTEGIDGWLQQEQLLVAKASSELGPYWSPPAKVRFRHHTTVVGDASRTGEHTRALLGDIGYTSAEIDALERAGVVRAAT